MKRYVCINSNIELFQKISTHTLWTTLNWVPKNFRISKKDNSSFLKFQSLLIQILRNSRLTQKLHGFPRIPVKIYKILQKFVDFQSNSLSISYRISNVVHGRCVDIFWNSPLTIRSGAVKGHQDQVVVYAHGLGQGPFMPGLDLDPLSNCRISPNFSGSGLEGGGQSLSINLKLKIFGGYGCLSLSNVC